MKWEAWRDTLHKWREATRSLMQYDGSLYDLPEFAWVPRAFSLGFLMMSDLQFYDPATGAYALDAVLDNAIADFGGYDAIILWHAYPMIGLDDRNQFDYYRLTLGGLDGLRAMVDRCHERGVRVYIDYNPWDTGTRREGVSDVDALVSLIKTIDADAIFLDTMSFGAEALRSRLDEVRPGVTLESENLVPLEHLHTHPSSWAQALPEGNTVGVLRNKWFERQHMQHRIKRWQPDHTEELHLAWMNGTGVVVWENVFGTSVRWSERYKSILRSMLPIQRRYADLLSGEEWTPLVPTMSDTLCASHWISNATSLWTICNRSAETYTGDLIVIAAFPGMRTFDLIAGIELFPASFEMYYSKLFPSYEVDTNTHVVIVPGTIRPRGIAAILILPDEAVDAEFLAFLEGQRKLDERANFDATPPVVVETLTPVRETKRRNIDALPPGMVVIPGREFDLRVQFRVRECGFYKVEGAVRLDLRFRNLHKLEEISRAVSVKPFAIDVTPVTNGQFAAFLQETGYQPKRPENFLAHWTNGAPSAGLEDHPVVYVTLEDARAYAAWAGKRLPTEEEWQHAAQGFGELPFGELTYPWGNTFEAWRCNGGAIGTTTPVTAYPEGRSPFGVYDMCGNVWELTESERSDGRTRSVILKGGAHYRAVGSAWYFDGGAQPNAFSAKLVLSHPGIDRAATVGFRCVVDVK